MAIIFGLIPAEGQVEEGLRFLVGVVFNCIAALLGKEIILM